MGGQIQTYRDGKLVPVGSGTRRDIDILPYDPNNPNASIYAPQRTTIEKALKRIMGSGALPEFKPVGYSPVTAQTAAPKSATARTATAREVGGITDTLGDDYFNMIEQQASRKMNEKFFGAPDSLARQQQAMMNKRGLIGSGIEAGGQNQLYKTFGDEMVDLQSNLAQKRLETAKELAFRNKEIEQANAAAFNEMGRFNVGAENEMSRFNVGAENEMGLANTKMLNETALQNAARMTEAAQKDREFQGFLSEIGLRGAADEARISTDFDTRMFEQQIKERDSEREFKQNLTDQLLRSLGEENIDKETRQYFEDIFGSKMGDVFGRPGPGSESEKMKTEKGKQEVEKQRRLSNLRDRYYNTPMGHQRDQMRREIENLENDLFGLK